jgi:hypothetical protein
MPGAVGALAASGILKNKFHGKEKNYKTASSFMSN